MVGNGVTDEEFDGNALVPFAHGMGLISDELFQVHDAPHLDFGCIVVNACLSAPRLKAQLLTSYSVSPTKICTLFKWQSLSLFLFSFNFILEISSSIVKL